jgi:hypothetical protein
MKNVLTFVYKKNFDCFLNWALTKINFEIEKFEIIQLIDRKNQ